MKFLMMMIPRCYQPSTPAAEKLEEGSVPRVEEMAEMGKFNDELGKVGTIIDLEGLQPLTAGARVSFTKGKAVFTDGPFIEAKEVIGGYWIIELKSKQEAVDWALRCPAADGDVIEIRPIFEFPDSLADTQQAAGA